MTMGIRLEEMLLHQSFLNILERHLEDLDGKMVGMEVDCRLPEESDDDSHIVKVSQPTIHQTLDLFRTIRSVISSSGKDKTLHGFFKVVVETFFRHLVSHSQSPSKTDSSKQPSQISEDFEMKSSCFSFILWLLCLPWSTSPTTDDHLSFNSLSCNRLRVAQLSQITTNPILCRSLVQCASLCFQLSSAHCKSNQPNHPDESEIEKQYEATSYNMESEIIQHDSNCGALRFLLHIYRHCYLLPSCTRKPRVACQEFLVCCLSHEDKRIRELSGGILYHCVSSNFAQLEEPQTGHQLSFPEGLARVTRQELSSILSAAVGNTPKRKSRNSKQQGYDNNNVESLTVIKLSRFLGFVAQVLPHLPAEAQLAILTQDLFEQFSAGSFLPLLRSARIPILGLQTISSYFQNFCPSFSCPSDESWDIRRKVVNCLITRQFSSFNAVRMSAQVKSIFEGLINLIEFMDDFSGGETLTPSTPALRIARRSDISDLLQVLTSSSRSFFRSAMVESDPTVQQEIVKGWIKLFKVASHMGRTQDTDGINEKEPSNDIHGGIMLYATICPVFLSLMTYKFKPIWKHLFVISTAVMNSIQDLALGVYRCMGQTPSHVVLSGYIATLGRLGNKTPTEIEILLNELITSLQSAQGFGQFYRLFSNSLLKSTFGQFIERLVLVLHEIEKPSSEALSILDRTTTGQLTSNQLESHGAAIYRNELRCCVGSAFKVFGSRAMLNFPNLSLDQLVTLPMTSSTFAYDSNSWVLPLMAEYISRDELEFFESYFLRLANKLVQKSQNLGSDEIGFIEARHYRRLAEQVWSLLPAFFREPLDLLTGIANGQIINAMMSELDKPVIRDHICLAIETLCRQLTPIIRCEISTEEESYEIKTPHTFIQRLWYEISQNDLTSLKHQTSKLMGMLTVKFLQMHRPTSGITGIPSFQSETSRGAQMLLEAIRSLVILCDSNLLESNLQKFSATWQSAVASAAVVISKPESASAVTVKNAFPLSPTDYGALVDVVDALIPQLPEPTVSRLFYVFLQLLQQSAEGLSHCRQPPNKIQATCPSSGPRKLKRGLGNLAPLSPAETSRQTLQCLLRRAFKGLKHVCERMEKSFRNNETQSDYEDFKTPEKLNELWQIVGLVRNVSRSIALKARMTFLRSYINLVSTVSHNTSGTSIKEMYKKILPDLAPEVLLGLSEGNKTIRQEAEDLLQAMASAPVSLEELVILLLPGLGSAVPAMKSSTVIALVVLLKSRGDLMSRQLIGRIVPLTIPLLRDEDKQVFRCTLSLVRAVQRRLSKDDVCEAFEAYIQPILKSKHTLSCRMIIRHIVDKAIKKVGVDRLAPLFPDSDLPLLYYVDRSQRRRALLHKKRLLEEEQVERDLEVCKVKAVGKAIRNYKLKDTNLPKLSTESDSEDEEAVENSADRSRSSIQKNQVEPCVIRSLLDELEAESEDENRKGNSRRVKRFISNPTPLATRIVEDLDPMDLLSAEPTRSTLNQPSPSAKRLRRNQCDQEAYKVGPDGRLVITEEALESGTRALDGFGSISKPDGLNPFVPSFKTTTKRTDRKSLSNLKEKRDQTKSIRRVKHSGHFIAKNPDVFKSKRAAGDIRKNSSVSPYAYIRLNPSMLKEKRRSEAVKSFKETARIGNRKPGKRKGNR